MSQEQVHVDFFEEMIVMKVLMKKVENILPAFNIYIFFFLFFFKSYSILPCKYCYLYIL